MTERRKEYRGSNPGARLKSQAGESIAETLIALLVSTVGLMMLAGMINTGAHLITRSRTTLRTYYTENNRLEEKGEGADGQVRVTIRFKEGDIPEEPLEAEYYENTAIRRRSVISYKTSE